jgi:hypothetical protein
MFNTGNIHSALLSDCKFRKNWRSETHSLTRNLQMWRILWAHNNASKWQMRFNSAFERLIRVKQGIFVGIFRHLFPLQMHCGENNLNIMLLWIHKFHEIQCEDGHTVRRERKLNYVYACTVKFCASEKVKITAMSYVMMYNIYNLVVFGCNSGVIYTRTLKNTQHSKSVMSVRKITNYV